MPWWLTTIFPALLICFVIGSLLGLLLPRRRIRQMETDFDRRRLEAEAESDRLRLRVSALRERDELANRLQEEVVELRAQSDRVVALQGQLQEAETRAHLVPALERQLTEMRERALRNDRLEDQVASLQAKLVQAQTQLAALPPGQPGRSGRAIERSAGAPSDTVAENQTLSAELRSTRIELEESRSRTGQLDAELRAALADRDRLRAEVIRNEQEEQELHARVTELEAEIVSLRAALAAPSPSNPTNPSSARSSARREADDNASAASNGTGSSDSDLGTGTADSDAGRSGADRSGDDDVSADATNADEGWQEGRTSLGTVGANHRDDLQAINGIGPVMERTLNSFGIRTWEQIASFTKEDIEKVSAAIKSFPGRIERDDWVGGAKELLAAGHVPGEDTTDRLLTSNRRRRQG